jgi:hypothetical protein
LDELLLLKLIFQLNHDYYTPDFYPWSQDHLSRHVCQIPHTPTHHTPLVSFVSICFIKKII